ncbi:MULTISPECIES: hypothetical protein [unclassified Methanosarcina]|uniref:hypothetical protein n=1 Tax=unclassified Methanosarcina TaxID=2644672 RepID=UPI000AABB486|nr:MULTISPECIES: hypothetical protein [unclassified Methanosarcina]
MTILKRIQMPQKNQNTGPAVFTRNSPVSGLSGKISIYSEPAVISRKLVIVNKSKIVRIPGVFGSEREKPFIE